MPLRDCSSVFITRVVNVVVMAVVIVKEIVDDTYWLQQKQWEKLFICSSTDTDWMVPRWPRYKSDEIPVLKEFSRKDQQVREVQYP